MAPESEPAALDQPAEWFAAGNEVGAGPYMIESYEPGQRMVLTKFEDWWQGWPEGSYDKVILEIVEDAAVRVQKLRGGEFYNPDTEFNIMFIGMYIGFDSPNEYLGSLWHSGWTWYPFSGFASEEFDTLVEQALALEAVDWDEADRLYQQAEQILYDQAVAVFALDLPQDWAIASDMAGFKPNPLYGYAAFLWTTYRQ
jgi:ABC-type transport system substrate-binding protein